MIAAMKRREFISLLGGAAALPLGARPQQPGKLPLVGFAAASIRRRPQAWFAKPWLFGGPEYRARGPLFRLTAPIGAKRK
jgi:hypothetical protein